MSSNLKKEALLLCALLAAAFSGKEPEIPEEIDYKELLSLAKQHQVYNIIFPVISALECVPAEEKEGFRNYSMSELKRMLVMNDERAKIFEALGENGVKYMPLKGLVLKDYYPKESMRQMSDNDILFDSKDRDIVAKIMRSFGYKTVATGENSDDYYKEPFSTFEFHRTLFFAENDFCPEFDYLWDNAKQDENEPCLYHMALSDIYIYNVCHMYKHYSTAGCGIRFLADSYLFLRKEGENIDESYIEEKLEEYGILDFEKKTRALAFKIFEEKELSEEEEQLLEVFLNFGIYGSGKVKLSRQFEAQGGSVEEAKRRYITQRLFPPKKKMLADYRALEKRPWLLPAYYVYRLFKGAAHTKETLDEFNSINSVEK